MHGTNRRSEEVSVDLANGKATPETPIQKYLRLHMPSGMAYLEHMKRKA